MHADGTDFIVSRGSIPLRIVQDDNAATEAVKSLALRVKDIGAAQAFWDNMDIAYTSRSDALVIDPSDACGVELAFLK